MTLPADGQSALLRWMQETDSSHPLFAEVAHDFLMSGFVFSLNRLVHRSRARLLGGLAMLGKISACLMAILLSASGVIGQSTFGSIVGVVKDPGEGTIADAQITLTNLDDHAQRNTSADGNGAFEFVNLKPGHYELVIHADGFSDYKVPSLQLDARQNL